MIGKKLSISFFENASGTKSKTFLIFSCDNIWDNFLRDIDKMKWKKWGNIFKGKWSINNNISIVFHTIHSKKCAKSVNSCEINKRKIIFAAKSFRKKFWNLSALKTDIGKKSEMCFFWKFTSEKNPKFFFLINFYFFY